MCARDRLSPTPPPAARRNGGDWRGPSGRLRWRASRACLPYPFAGSCRARSPTTPLISPLTFRVIRSVVSTQISDFSRWRVRYVARTSSVSPRLKAATSFSRRGKSSGLTPASAGVPTSWSGLQPTMRTDDGEAYSIRSSNPMRVTMSLDPSATRRKWASLSASAAAIRFPCSNSRTRYSPMTAMSKTRLRTNSAR